MIKEKSKRLASMCEQVYYEVTHVLWDKLDRHFYKQEAPSPWKEKGFNKLQYIAAMPAAAGDHIYNLPGGEAKEAARIVKRHFLALPLAERFAFLCHITDMYDDGEVAATALDAAVDVLGSWQIHLMEIYLGTPGLDKVTLDPKDVHLPW